ncbi:hypothetical protein BJY01DRAFT_216942 [Aspergillus pseudoustus]|uniref:NAD(P)-binding protein n=1 Tax=Aspergillus pseudoustus TaxID=1810923 RepID=A0ABR4JQB4_9EURO
MLHTQKSILITGCTKSSIGYALAQEFAALNYKVYATARKVSNMGDLASTRPNITLLALDVSSPDSIAAVKQQVALETAGKLDIIYHNAGYRVLAMAAETPLSETQKTFDANLFGIVEMNRQFADMLVAAKGTIVFTSSLSAYTPHPSHALYCASKAALHIYAGALRTEMKPFGIRVVLVNTGGVKTDMSSQRIELQPDSHYRYLEGKINDAWDAIGQGQMTVEEYAKQVVRKIAKSKATVIWSGSHTWSIWLAEHLNLQWVYDVYFARLYGLNNAAPPQNN